MHSSPVSTRAKTFCLFCNIQWMVNSTWGLQPLCTILKRDIHHFHSLAAQAPHIKGQQIEVYVRTFLRGSFWNCWSGFNFWHNCTKTAFNCLSVLSNGMPYFIKSNTIVSGRPWLGLFSTLPNPLAGCQKTTIFFWFSQFLLSLQ